MFVPFIIILASALGTAPMALADSREFEISTNPETLGAYVRVYFADAPEMAEIAWCESRMRHLAKDGSVFRGRVDSDDIGVMQINTRYHQETADELDIDIYSLQGNLAYARYLYEKEGTKPWNSSKPCWANRVKNLALLP
ncbi:MAG: hypothetical protein AAB573_02145 [Patescibacteria group bacterium]|mgnify:CR=1 FL=1